MKKIAIIGNGRFGQVLFNLLRQDFLVSFFNTKNSKTENDLKKIYENEVIFFAMPISVFDSVIKLHKKHFKDNHLLIDVLSVKIHPKKVFEEHLRGLKTQALLTHPMFGPDSSKNGFDDLPIIIDKFKTNDKNFSFWKDFFIKKGLKVIEMSAEKHDQLAANSQGLTHFIGRMLGELKFAPTPIDSIGTKKLLEVMEQTCNDTWQLFSDLQNFNPYTKLMRIKLGRTYDLLYNQLLPKKINKKKIIFGIQGGKGSFNEEALQYCLKTNSSFWGLRAKRGGLQNSKKRFWTSQNDIVIKYLYTTEKVLKNLHEGNIDYGLFAIQNAVGGVVEESTYAMARYKFKIINEFQIVIRHTLMKRKDIGLSSIKTVMAHSQNFRQCKNSLKNKYPNLKPTIGRGDLLDTARCAEALSKNNIDKNTAILGPKILAEIYDLEIIDENLQDSKNNLTSFFLVSR
ncbi:MAG: prephenate dehydrogenase/arogenate dehydrogenase family protein [Candidatus Roizmanbacteria bacterium]|nr:prephenate dehydrogenase/arogenate dehydrogenase family protein [Candidatus Roizmanbacteria bacterium]